MPFIAMVPLTTLIVGARAELLRNGQDIGPQLAQVSGHAFSEDFWVFLSFLSDRSVFSTLWQNVLKILRSLGKERKTQKFSLTL